MAASPIYEALKSRVRMTVSSGSQDATDFDLVILDGDGFTAQQLKEEEELVHSAIRGGVWVLGLDLSEDHKGDGLGHFLGAGTPEKSHAYLVQLTRSLNGHPRSTYIDFRDDQADAALQAQRIVSYIGGEELQAQQVNDQEPTDPPKGALMWEHRVTQPWNIVLPRKNNFGHAGLPVQTASWTQTYDIRLYLENDSANPAGKSQWVAIEQQGQANPGALAINYTDCTTETPSCDYNPFRDNLPSYEIAWPQTLFTPQAAISGNLFGQVSTSPPNQNKAKSVTTASTFQIGVSQVQGSFATYTYSTTSTRAISEWKVSNDSNPAATNPTASWRFGSEDPYDGFNTNTGSGLIESGGRYFPPSLDLSLFQPGASDGTVKQPNDLSKGDFAYATSSVWQLRGQKPSTATVFIGGVDTAWYVDAYTQIKDTYDSNGGFISEAVYGHVERYSNQQTWGLDVNLGAVVPVPFKQGGFGIQQADGTIVSEMTAGQTVDGVVTLAAPANADAVVYLNVLTNGYGVTIPTDFITIPKGQTTGTFKIQSAACPPSYGAARLTAFYGGGLNQQITVVKPPSCN